MIGVAPFWLPILLSAVFVFAASSVIHMASPWHKSDYPKLPNEDQLMDAVRPLGIAPGDYMVPRPDSREDMRSPAFKEKVRKGPVMMLTVWPSGPVSMGRNLALWFVYTVAIGVFAAYVAGHALLPAASSRQIFRFAGITAFIGYTAALWQMSIWYQRAWTTTIKATIDGLIYALLTAIIFVWLWPR